MHKTKRALIDTVLQLMDGIPSTPVTLQDVLTTSGLTSGALYYHFEDFPDLIDHALIDIYSSYTTSGISGLAEIIANSSSVEEAKVALATLIQVRHSDSQAKIRAAVAWIAAQATFQPSLQQKLGPAQLEMTEKIADVILSGQQKGLVNTQRDPYALAVFIQAYALGRIVDDLAGKQMDGSKWYELIFSMVTEFMLVEK